MILQKKIRKQLANSFEGLVKSADPENFKKRIENASKVLVKSLKPNSAAVSKKRKNQGQTSYD